MATAAELAAIEAQGLTTARFITVEADLDHTVNDFYPYPGGSWSERRVSHQRASSASVGVSGSSDRTVAPVRQNAGGVVVSASSSRSLNHTRSAEARAFHDMRATRDVPVQRAANAAVVVDGASARSVEIARSASTETVVEGRSERTLTLARDQQAGVLVSGRRQDVTLSFASRASSARAFWDLRAPDRIVSMSRRNRARNRAYMLGDLPARPVWSFEHDWSSDFVKAYEWITQIAESQTGVEQRRSVREVPRVSYDYRFKLFGAEAMALEQAVFAGMGSAWYVPDASEAAEAFVRGDLLDLSESIGLRAGDVVTLVWTATQFEVVRVQSVIDDKTVRCAVEVPDRGGPARVYRTKLAWPTGTINMERVSSGALRGAVQFESQTGDLTAPVGLEETYLGFPVRQHLHDWRSASEISFTGRYVSVENPFGFDARQRTAARDRSNHQVSLSLTPEERGVFEEWIQYRRGRATPYWDTSLTDDLQVVPDAQEDPREIRFDSIGFVQAGGPRQGYAHVRVSWFDGSSSLHRIVSAHEHHDERSEVVRLDPPLRQPASPGSVLTVSFMELKRLDQDRVEVAYRAGRHGLARASFRVTPAPDDRRLP